MSKNDHAAARETLRSAGIRVTMPRVSVLSAISRCGPHQSAEAIATATRDLHGTISTQAVYDTLHLLVGYGLVRRIDLAGNSPSFYELRVGDNHHHLVCRSCGIVHDVDCAVGDAPCLQPSATFDFKIDEAEVTFWGTCPDCLSTQLNKPIAPNTEETHDLTTD
ncbi:MAG TPA: Fur family transcriptional regulator [Capsulimonadaceae bacterium]|jgi:Fur family ferric uptake transcriptional regulator